jgi:hypothetical protein
MSTIRTSSIYHYTREFRNLKSILVEGIRPNFCFEYYPNPKDDDYGIGIPMVSFCDIPLTKINNFSKRYGSYGIGFKKNWGVNNMINPVLYVRSDILKISLYNLKSLRTILTKAKDEYVRKYAQSIPNTTKKEISLFNNEHGEEILRNVVLLNSSEYAFYHLHGFSKYVPDILGKNSVYEENEWRYLVRDEEDHRWFWGIEDYQRWRGPEKDSNGRKTKKPNSGIPLLKFKVEDVNYIIVKKEKQIPPLIDFLHKLNNIGGSEKLLSDSDLKILLTKIISLEVIDHDF